MSYQPWEPGLLCRVLGSELFYSSWVRSCPFLLSEHRAILGFPSLKTEIPEGLKTETGSTVSWELGSVSTLNMLVVPHLPHDQLCPTGGKILSVQRFKG